LETKSSNLFLTLTTFDDVINLADQVENVQETFNTRFSELSAYESLVLENEKRSSISQSLHEEATVAVDNLRNSFDALEVYDRNGLLSFEAIVRQVKEDVSSANIDQLYEYLLEKLSQQRQLRTELQNQVNMFQQQLAYLKHIDSSLPPVCNS